MLAETDGQSLKTENWAPWLLVLMLVGYMFTRLAISPPEPEPQILPLADLSTSQLQLIPHIGPVLAEELKNLQGHDLKSCRGIGASREQILLCYLTTSSPSIP